MSASNNKKPQADSGKLTDKQLQEQKQNKEVKMYTIGFTVVMALILVIAIVAGGMQVYSNAGVRERKTVAYTVGDHQLNSAEMGYFFTDAVNNFMNQYGAYAAMFGLDTTKPLTEQIVDEEAGTTWADDFMNSAKESAKSVYTLADEARAKGHTLNEQETEIIKSTIANLDLYAQVNGLGSAKAYLKAMYGNGATVESYKAYLENSVLADSYRAAYAESLTYEDADFREHEKENFDQYSSFTFNQYYLSADRFLQGGTKDEEGNVTHTQEEKDAAIKACEETAKALTADTITSAADLDKAIAALEINKETPDAASTLSRHKDYNSLSSDIVSWISDASRKAGDTTYVANNISSQDEEGNPVTTVGGYNIYLFVERDDNQGLLPNVRHILLGFEGGTTNENGLVTYSDEEKAAAKQKAEEVLAKYEAGEKTEDAFAALATENSTDDGSKENGGLYENVYQGQMVPTFNDWVFDAERKAGDTGIVESDYGFHVMYFCGDGTMSYRDSQIKSELMSADMDAWFKGLMDAATTADGDTSLIKTDLVLNR